MLRLFVAVTLPKDALEACGREAERVRAALTTLAGALRFPRAEGLHVTMKFLGATPDEVVEPIQTALRRVAAGGAPFALRLAGLEAFPNVRRPRVVYIGVTEGAQPMIDLAAGVERELAPLGFPTEKRAFTPHVTLARVGDPKLAAKVGAKLAAVEPVELCRVQIDKLSLMQSQLNPGGSRYTELAAFPLGR